MSDGEVDEFRLSNNKIVVTNFNPDSADVILKPTPTFEHAFHNHPGILDTISGQLDLAPLSTDFCHSLF
jgi:hypothetical protein